MPQPLWVDTHATGPRKEKGLLGAASSPTAVCLMMLGIAGLVKCLEHVKQRDMPEPKNYKQAIASEYGEWWDDAILTELENLDGHEIWEWVKLPPGRRCIDTTWRFRAKPTLGGGIDKLKARLCARGFKQIHGLDFTETHAPVTVMSAWRANVAEMAEHGWDFDIFDVSGAYLKAPLLEEIYVLC